MITSSCSVSRTYVPNQKIAPQKLQADYDLFRAVLEESHPGLYWYTSKDSMDFYFERGRALLKDSLTEPRFRSVLSYVISKIGCGHTVALPSRAFVKKGDSLRNRFFPLVVKAWPDTVVVIQNLHRDDSLLPRGTRLTSIEDRPVQQVVDSLFRYLSTDGYNLTHKYQTLSNRGAFGSLYTAVYGYKPWYRIGYVDTLGREGVALVRTYTVKRDTAKGLAQPPKPSRRKRRSVSLAAARSLRTDTSLRTAFMVLNTFSGDARLRPFFRKTFRGLRRSGTENLVIDLRANGGGRVTYSNLLTKYIADKPFKIADSLYALTRKSRYRRYQQNAFWNRLFLLFLTRKGRDGNYHFRYYENRYFSPKRKNHFDGKVYLLTGGNTFSAATLFAQAVGPQANVVLLGEETGGGAYGNNAWLIPDITLPQTGLRFRLPLFRLVIDRTQPKGLGLSPEIFAGPSTEAIRKGVDYKMEVLRRLLTTSPPPSKQAE